MYKIYKIRNNNLSNYQIKILAHTIYNNFPELIYEPSLKHNMDEITRLLKSKNMVGYIVFNDNKVISYLFGEYMKLQDSRIVYYINYIFTSVCSRKRGLASRLLNMITKNSASMNASHIVLTCNTEDDYIQDYYLKKGFMPDLIMRRYAKYDVLSLQIT